jgi:hypothetical protein
MSSEESSRAQCAVLRTQGRGANPFLPVLLLIQRYQCTKRTLRDASACPCPRQHLSQRERQVRKLCVAS